MDARGWANMGKAKGDGGIGCFRRRTRRSLLRAGGTCAQRQKDAAGRCQTPPSKSVHSISHAWAAQKVVIRSGKQLGHLESEEAQPCPNSSIRYSPPSTAAASASSSKRTVRERECQLQKLLSSFHRHGRTRRQGRRRPFRQCRFNPVHIQAASGRAALEAVQHFSRLLDLTGLKVKDAQGRVASDPFRQKIDGLFEVLRRLRSLTFQNRNKPRSPKQFP